METADFARDRINYYDKNDRLYSCHQLHGAFAEGWDEALEWVASKEIQGFVDQAELESKPLGEES